MATGETNSHPPSQGSEVSLLYNSNCLLSSSIPGQSSSLSSSIGSGSEFRVSSPGGSYHFGLTVSEIEEIPGVDVRKTPSGEVYVVVSEDDLERVGDPT